MNFIFTMTDKVLILNELKKFYNFKKELDFANFLEIKPQTLSSWYKRNTFDIELIFAKCKEINADWLFTGKGEMLRIETGKMKSEEIDIDSKKILLDMNEKVDFIYKHIAIDVARKELESLQEEINKAKAAKKEQ